MRRLFKSFLFVLLAGALAVSAFAQSSTANIRGKVTNDQGTALPGATVDGRRHRLGIRQDQHRRPRRRLPARRPHPGGVHHHGGGAGIPGALADGDRPRRTEPERHVRDGADRRGQRIDHRHRRAGGRHADPGGGDQRHHAADREPAAGQPQLPQLRGARARHPDLGRSAAQDDLRRRPAGRADQRLHRRRELQERRAAGGPGRPGRQPRQPVPAERRAGVPRHHAELQRPVRQGVERDHHRRHQVGRQRRARAALLVLPAQAVGVGAAAELPVLDADLERGVQAQPARLLDRRTDHQRPAPLLPLL